MGWRPQTPGKSGHTGLKISAHTHSSVRQGCAGQLPGSSNCAAGVGKGGGEAGVPRASGNRHRHTRSSAQARAPLRGTDAQVSFRKAPMAQQAWAQVPTKADYHVHQPPKSSASTRKGTKLRGSWLQNLHQHAKRSSPRKPQEPCWPGSLVFYRYPGPSLIPGPGDIK